MTKLYALESRILLMILLITISTCSNSSNTINQNTNNTTKGSYIFEGFDFEKENYALVLIAEPERKEGERLNYYTYDKNLLKEIKDKWSFGEASYGRCSPAYSLYLLNNDTICFKFQVSIDCNELFLNNKQYSFDAQGVFVPILGSYNLLNKHYVEFNSYSQRDSFVSKIDKDETILNEITNFNNINFEHTYRFLYEENTKEDRRYKYKIDSLLLSLKNEITTRYPKEDFVLECSYFNANKDRTIFLYQIDLYCHNSLYEKFDLYKKENNFDLHKLKLIYFTKSGESSP